MKLGSVILKEHKMLPIRGLFEIAIPVKDLSRAETFYREVLGLEIGIRDEKRNWLFLRAGGQAGMVVLQENKGEWPAQHFAFSVEEKDIERAAKILNEQGVEIDGPYFHEWMPAKSVYFSDPDGHNLELCATVIKIQ
jgi:catechol 2,3-dioxygenase-like lactoylglutathione lyase family enzyme